MVNASAENETWRDHLVAIGWIAVIVSFLPASLTLAFWMATSTNAPPVLIALVGLSGLTLAVLGSGSAASTLLRNGDLIAAQRRLGLSKRTSTNLDRISQDLRVASDEPEWTPRVRAALRNSAESVDVIANDLNAAADALAEAGLRNSYSAGIRGLLGLALTWVGTLMQGVAVWWTVS